MFCPLGGPGLVPLWPWIPVGLLEVIVKLGTWGRRMSFLSAGVVALAVIFLVMVRASGVSIAGVKPEALVLTAMMTAPFTLGFLALLVLGAVGAERMCRWGRRGGSSDANLAE